MPLRQNKKGQGRQPADQEGATRVLAGPGAFEPRGSHSDRTPSPARTTTARTSATATGPTHERRRSGRVTNIRPKATAMLTVHARTEERATALAAPTAGLPRLGSVAVRCREFNVEFDVGGFDALAGRRQRRSPSSLGPDARGDPYYAQARELAANLAREGFAVITGGGRAS